MSYVKKLGFKSSYDEKILPAIKFIGLVEDKRGGSPTELWGQLRTNMEAAQRMGDTGAAEMWRRQLEKGEADASRRRLDRGRLERATTAGEAEGGD